MLTRLWKPTLMAKIHADVADNTSRWRCQSQMTVHRPSLLAMPLIFLTEDTLRHRCPVAIAHQQRHCPAQTILPSRNRLPSREHHPGTLLSPQQANSSLCPCLPSLVTDFSICAVPQPMELQRGQPLISFQSCRMIGLVLPKVAGNLTLHHVFKVVWAGKSLPWSSPMIWP